MPLFALTPELVASIQAQYPSLETLNLSGNGAARRRAQMRQRGCCRRRVVEV